MARGVGELVVTLALNAADYFSGLTKAERETKAFVGRLNTGIAQVGKVLGGLAIGSILLENTKEIIAQASALNDLSDVTGSSVEALSKLSNQAAIAGTDMATLEGALVKLSVGMADTSEEGSKTQQALKLLGITTRDPVEAMQQAGAKLAEFGDGVNKVGIAAALFGAKAGPRFLAALKDINELGDVNATVTKKQADEAEALEKAYRRLSYEATGFRNAILSDVVPALTRLIQEFQEALRLSGGFSDFFRLFALGTRFDEPTQGIQKYKKEIEDLQKRQAEVDPRTREWKELAGDIDDATKRLKFYQFQFRNSISIDPNDFNVRDQIMLRKPQAPKLPDGGGKDNTAKKLLDQQLKALDALIRGEEETLRDRESFLRAYFQDDLIGVRDFFAGRSAAIEEAFAKESAAYDKQIATLQEFIKKTPKSEDRIDAETKLADVIAKRGRLQQDVATQSAQNFLEESRALRQLRDSIEQASIALAEMRGDTVTAAAAGFDFANRQIKAQLGFLAASPNPGDQALAAIGQRTLDDQRALVVLRAQLTKATEDYQRTLEEVGLTQAQIDLAQQRGDLTSLEALFAKSAAAEKFTAILREQIKAAEELAAKTGRPEDALRVRQLRLEMERLAATGDLVAKQFNDIFAGALTDAITDAVTGTKSLKEAFLDMEKAIVNAISRIAAQNIAEALFGKSGSGGSDIGKLLAQIFAGIVTGGAGGGGGGLNLSGYGPAFAATGGPIAGPTIVGERGPELFVPKTVGSILPNNRMGDIGGNTFHVTVNVPKGADTASIKQATLRGVYAAQDAWRNR